MTTEPQDMAKRLLAIAKRAAPDATTYVTVDGLLTGGPVCVGMLKEDNSARRAELLAGIERLLVEARAAALEEAANIVEQATYDMPHWGQNSEDMHTTSEPIPMRAEIAAGIRALAKGTGI